MANTRFHLQQEYLARTFEVEERAAASENAYANLHRELLEQRDQLQANQAHLMEGGLHLQGQYTEHVQQLWRELQEAHHQRVLDSESGTASRQIIQGERAIIREIWQSKLRDGEPIQWRSLMRAELQCQPTGKRLWPRETLLINSRNILLRLRPRWMTGVSGTTRNMGVSMRWCRRIKRMKTRLLKVQPVIPAPQQPQSTPITPPVLQGHVPVELLPPTQLPSFVMTPLPPVQPATTTAPPPPPPPGPPPSEESPQQASQPMIQQPGQPEPSVPSQQSLPSTHRCPDVHGPVAPVTQEYVPGRAPPPPMTPSACLQQDTTRVPIAPTSPPGYHGGVQAGSPPSASPPPPQPPVGDGSAWSYLRQMHRSSPHAAQAVEAQPLPTSAGVSEPSLCQHSHSPPRYQWAAGSTAGASTSLSNAGALPAMAVNTGSGAPAAPDGSGGMGSQPNTQPPTQPRMEQPISKNKSPSLNSALREEILLL